MRRLTCLLCLLLFAAPARAESPEPWEQISDEEGIRVWQRKVPGKAIVEFKGEGIVLGPVAKAAAIVRNLDRHCEWEVACVESRSVKRVSLVEDIGYYRLTGDFPLVDDRDVVFAAKMEVLPEDRKIFARFWHTDTPKIPVPDDVVRMPVMRGHWELIEVDAKTTLALYTLRADPGGWIPTFVVNFASRELPLAAITGLRKQMSAAGYEAETKQIEALLGKRALGLSAPKADQVPSPKMKAAPAPAPAPAKAP